MNRDDIRAAAATALIRASRPKQHGQHCPVWTKRRESSADCNCWRRGQLEEQVDALAAVGLLPSGVEKRELDDGSCGVTTDWKGENVRVHSTPCTRQRRYVGEWVTE